jgi:uridine kinase
MKHTTNNFSSEQQKREFVLQCEHEFEQSLDDAANFIINTKGLSMVAITGPTCSGKTTTSKKIIKELTASGLNARVISIDDFFKDRASRLSVPGVKVDYDSIDALDFPYLAECVSGLDSGKTVKMPLYDFVTGTRSGYYDLSLKKGDILVFEGIQAMYRELTELFSAYNCLKVFISVASSLFVDDENDCHDRFFDGNELRLLRRIVRDHRERNASPEFTFYIWESVRENEEKNIFPNIDAADIRLDSTLAYEANLIKPYIEPLMDLVPADSSHRSFADAVLYKLAPLEPIDASYVPANSVYREFLG